ncbi:TPA: lipid kinase, partial [Staphylococcus aureus]
MENKYTHGVLFYHEHSGLKNINQGIGEVTTALSSICKHLSIQLSENEGDIIKYCQE